MVTLEELRDTFTSNNNSQKGYKKKITAAPSWRAGGVVGVAAPAVQRAVRLPPEAQLRGDGDGDGDGPRPP